MASSCESASGVLDDKVSPVVAQSSPEGELKPQSELNSNWSGGGATGTGSAYPVSARICAIVRFK